MPNSVVVKQSAFRFLFWIFEGETFTLSFAVMLYLFLWFTPMVEHGNTPGLDETVWHQIGWGPSAGTALIILPLAVLQVLCARWLNCVWWLRLAVSVILFAFLAYTTFAPSYVAFLDTGYLPESVAGATTVTLTSLLIVARQLRRH